MCNMLCYIFTFTYILQLCLAESETSSSNNITLLELKKLYNNTIDAHQAFIRDLEDANKKMVKNGIVNNFMKINKDRFLQIRLKGPVNVENIRDGLYDTQAKRNPSSAKIFIDEREDLNRLYEDAKEYNLFNNDSAWDSFQSNLHQLAQDV